MKSLCFVNARCVINVVVNRDQRPASIHDWRLQSNASSPYLWHNHFISMGRGRKILPYWPIFFLTSLFLRIIDKCTKLFNKTLFWKKYEKTVCLKGNHSSLFVALFRLFPNSKAFQCIKQNSNSKPFPGYQCTKKKMINIFFIFCMCKTVRTLSVVWCDFGPTREALALTRSHWQN